MERVMHAAPHIQRHGGAHAAHPTRFSHCKPLDSEWRSHGLRDFFLYKDLGVEAAPGGRVVAQLVKANHAPELGTGWHRHEADFHIVIMTRGWAKFM